MLATEDLRSEHKGVIRMLRIMERMAGSIDRGGAPDADDLSRIVGFLRVFVDKCHHSKEEELLFPALRAGGIASVDAVIADLLADHVRGREAVARLDALVPDIRAGDRSAAEQLSAVLTAYTALLFEHIVREESECFSVADRELPDDVQRALEEGYDRIEREVVGGGVHESLHALLDELEAKTAPA